MTLKWFKAALVHHLRIRKETACIKRR